jgi:hypothetical protein
MQTAKKRVKYIFTMKAMVLGGLTGVLLLVASLPSASAGQVSASRTEVQYVPTGVRIEFVHPERFTDFRLQRQSEFATSRIFAREISATLESVLARRVPGGSLSLRFNDVDLAGRYEPWRGPQFDRVRFVRFSSTPIRLQFDYTLTDGQGRIISSGSRNLVDTYYLDRYPDALSQSSYDQLFFEKRLLENWLRQIS